jgi:hypothetical protein
VIREAAISEVRLADVAALPLRTQAHMKPVCDSHTIAVSNDRHQRRQNSVALVVAEVHAALLAEEALTVVLVAAVRLTEAAVSAALRR